MKAVLMSIQPKWCELIANGKKTVELRKTKPKLETPFKVYIYCTQGDKSKALLGGNPMRIVTCTDYRVAIPVGCYIGNGKVIGEFVCDCIGTVGWISNPNKKDWKDGFNKETCLTNRETYKYTKGDKFYEWHISDLVIYDKPRELSEFKKHNRTCYYDHLGLAIPKCKECKGCQLTRPPQSWCYVESKE